ncbi:MAG: sigma-54-dependent Fis family transcriptional regulator [Deltaproteobacteria bacterium]|nr:MAG: sigma-54-dependent Fis family transcriptional regulator [Deltaproteobacteria bacterium]
MQDQTHTLDSHPTSRPRRGPALVVAWLREEPGRVGERMLFTDGRTVVFGRGGARPDDPHPRTWPLRLRPGRVEDGGPFESRTISRVQASVRRSGQVLHVENLGRATMYVDGREAAQAEVRPGSILLFDGRLVLLCVDSPSELPDLGLKLHPFGEPDEHGIVGESEAAWELRRQLAFVGPRQPHVLVVGPSGAGKELAARAIHRLSPRAEGPLVDRNAATLPEGLVDAELFGHARNYPNHGMPERRGLIGEAEGGTLFLDEFAELPHASQAHLLRVLDDGRYQRLGESRPRTADLRLVAATNRAPESLKHDLRARLRLTVELAGLDQRREDIALLQRHLLARILANDVGLVAQLGGEVPAFSAEFAVAALRHPWTTHARELEAWIWQALSTGTAPTLEPPLPTLGGGTDDGEGTASVGWEAWVGRDPADIPKEALASCLAAHNGNQQEVWRALGLSSRYVLRRLIKKHGLAVTRQA